MYFEEFIYEKKSMMMSKCQLYITVEVCVCLCALHVKNLCLMKIAGDLEISPICGIL